MCRNLCALGCKFPRCRPAFVIEYDGEAVGWIEDGRAAESLRLRLLDEWRKRLQ